MTRMCSICRKAIGDESLTLNGVFAHLECVEKAMREPYGMTSASDDQLRAEIARRGITCLLKDNTDAELRAECERRGMGSDRQLPKELFDHLCRLMGHRNGFGWDTLGKRVDALLATERNPESADAARSLAAAINTPPDPARVEAIRPSFTLVQSVSRNLTMPECGDSCELRGVRYVCSQADYTRPGHALLTFVKSERSAALSRAAPTLAGKLARVEQMADEHWVDPLDLLADDA